MPGAEAEQAERSLAGPVTVPGAENHAGQVPIARHGLRGRLERGGRHAAALLRDWSQAQCRQVHRHAEDCGHSLDEEGCPGTAISVPAGWGSMPYGCKNGPVFSRIWHQSPKTEVLAA